MCYRVVCGGRLRMYIDGEFPSGDSSTWNLCSMTRCSSKKPNQRNLRPLLPSIYTLTDRLIPVDSSQH